MTISDLSELLAASESVLASFKGQPWWRGHAVETWQLVPKVFRKDLGLQYESNIARKFAQRAPTRHAKCPMPDDQARWLFLAQHYGLPTRLLDWTESPLLALYFAVCEDLYLTNNGCLWAIDPFAINKVMIDEAGLALPGNAQVASLVELAFLNHPADDRRLAAILTEEVDLRMMVQLSGFTIHGSPQPLEERDGVQLFIRKFTINKAAKKHLRDQLASLGVRERTVFPDLEHLARDLTRDRY